MATEIGAPSSGVATSALGEYLGSDAASFEFFQAVALLQQVSGELRPVGGFSSPEEEVVHFRVNPRLGFPASEIQELDLPEAGPAEMVVNFMGLTGPLGVLPHPYSELILERLHAKDRSLASFFDIFNHRAISLFFRAWLRSRLHVSYGAGARDYLTQYLRDFLGLGTTGLSERQQVEDEALMPFVALLAMQPRSAMALEQVLTRYFDVPVEVEQFTGAWYPIGPSLQCEMEEEDSMSTQVGCGAVVGDAVWDRQGRARIRIGPLSLERYLEFLPDGSAYPALRAITRFFSNDCIDFEAQLILDRKEVPGVELDAGAEQPARLGWVSWARTKPFGANAEDTILEL